MRLKPLACLGLVFALCGCATAISSINYPVTVTSSVEGESVAIHDEDGNFVHEGITPFTVTLAAGAGYFDAASYTLASETGGTAEFYASFDPWYLGNILTLSVSGLLWVDPGSGAMWQLDDEVHVASPAAEAATR